MVRSDIVCTEQPKFQTNCEILWVKVEITGVHPLFVCAFYNTKEDNQEGLLELHRYIEAVKKKAKGKIWLLGDFSLSKLTWQENIPTLKPDCSLKHVYDIFLDTINDFSLTQMVTQPTIYENTLDLFLTTNPTLIQQVSCQPGLSDHDMVIAHCSLTPTAQKQKPRKVPIFRKADLSKFKSLMRDYQQKFLSSHIGRSVEELWNDFTSTLDLYSFQCIPVKTFWITKEIRRQIRKRNHFYKQFKKTDSKKLFSFLQSSKQDQLGTPALNHGDRLVTETAEKADLHNLQFQSVITTKAPLSLSRLCKMKLQDMTDCDGIPVRHCPEGCRSLLLLWKTLISLWLAY